MKVSLPSAKTSSACKDEGEIDPQFTDACVLPVALATAGCRHRSSRRQQQRAHIPAAVLLASRGAECDRTKQTNSAAHHFRGKTRFANTRTSKQPTGSLTATKNPGQARKLRA